jgi:hypothetical protein
VAECKPDEIELTPDMIEAGAECLITHPIVYPSEEEFKIVVADVFRAMLEARKKSDL